MHEFGHVLRLEDLDAKYSVSNGTHNVLMGYDRNTTEETLHKAIKYQDIQGVAVANGIHTDHLYYRYVQQGNMYKHICFYCDRIDSCSTIMSGSQPVQGTQGCNHNYQQFVSSGYVHWYKCTKCYKVIEKDYYQINYENLEFMGQEAVVFGIDDYFSVEHTYIVGDTYNVHGASAFWAPSNPYGPQLIFLGWYTNMNFTTLAPQITATTTGDVTYYAKWRYDFNYLENNGVSVNSSSPLSQNATTLTLGLNTNNLYNELLNIGITKLTINFKMRSAGVGTQYVYLYSASGTKIAGTTFAGTSAYSVHNFQFTVDLATIGSAGNIYIRYQSQTGKTWNANIQFVEIAYIVNSQDLNMDNNEFTWRYMDPL